MADLFQPCVSSQILSSKNDLIKLKDKKYTKRGRKAKKKLGKSKLGNKKDSIDGMDADSWGWKFNSKLGCKEFLVFASAMHSNTKIVNCDLFCYGECDQASLGVELDLICNWGDIIWSCLVYYNASLAENYICWKNRTLVFRFILHRNVCRHISHENSNTYIIC